MGRVKCDGRDLDSPFIIRSARETQKAKGSSSAFQYNKKLEQTHHGESRTQNTCTRSASKDEAGLGMPPCTNSRVVKLSPQK